MESRSLLLFFDGTNNQFGAANTSIVRLVQVLDRHPEKQLVFYDPGVGTLPEPGGVTALGKWISKVAGLTIGAGVFGNIGDAYGYLMEHWRPGDRAFVFGFSRGAYTARALAALLHMFGLLPPGGQNLLPYLLRLLKASRHDLEESKQSMKEYWTLTREFRETFARIVPERADRRFPTHFLGLFDTVSSVGWFWNPLKLPFTAGNPSVATARHAISIDERRCFFRQNSLKPLPNQDVLELWFNGVHSDVGGGYPESEGGLWREAYAWMLAEAKSAGLLTDPERERDVWNRSTVPPNPWAEPQHESLTGAWWLAEFLVPKLVYNPASGKRRLELGFGRRRRTPAGAPTHASVQLRLRGVRRP